MKHAIITIFVVLSFLFSFYLNSIPIKNDFQIEEESEGEPPGDYFKDWYYPNSERSPEDDLKVMREIAQLPDEQSLYKIDKHGIKSISSTDPWIQKGPVGIRYGSYVPEIYYSGRVNCLAYNSSLGLLAGTANGGLWKFVGSSATALSDNVASLRIGGVAVDPGNHNNIIIGTGDYDGRVAGAGVFRTTNGGSTWTNLTLPATFSTVAKVIIKDTLLFVVGSNGISRSTDFGNSWNPLVFATCCDMAIANDQSYILIAVENLGIWKSTDRGVSKTHVPYSLFPGVDSSKVRRIAVAISKSSPSISYVQFAEATGRGRLHGLYKSTNSGVSWNKINSPSDPEYLAQQRFNNVLSVHPSNSNIVWAGGVSLWRSSDGGNNWTGVGAVGGWPHSVHGDFHALLYVGSRLYAASDGGLFYTDDEGTTWNSSFNRSLPITQFYNIGVEWDGGRIKCGGTQDNGNMGTTISNPDAWTIWKLGDGVDAAVDMLSPSNLYFTHNGGAYDWRTRSIDGGVNWSSINSTMSNAKDTIQSFWHTYISVFHSQAVGRRLFTNAGYYLYWSSNNGDSWSRMGNYQSLVPAKRPAENSDGNFVYLPVDDLYQRIAGFSYNTAGNNWTMTYISTGLPDKGVKRISTGILDPDRAYALIYGVGDNLKIFKTINRGSNWNNITGDLPDVPVNDIVEFGSKLYLGTDKGAFISTNNGVNWVRWCSGMPVAAQILDLELTNHADGWYVVAGTYGRSTFERKVTATEAVFFAGKYKFNFGSVSVGQWLTDSVTVYNRGEDQLTISNIRGTGGAFVAGVLVNPPNSIINPGDSVKFFVSFTPPVGVPNLFVSEIEFIHDGIDSPTRLQLECYIGDGTLFRTFPPESLMVKKEIKRKSIKNNWKFTFENTLSHRDPPKSLIIEFKKPVLGFTSYLPFETVIPIDSKGYKWKFTDGSVKIGSSATVTGYTKSSHTQSIKKWWWEGDIVVWSGETEGTTEGVMGGINSSKNADWQAPGFGLPNAANLRKEVFINTPINKYNSIVIGIADPDARTKKVSYLAFTKESDLIGSLMPGRSGKIHDGPVRKFDFFDNGKEMIGAIRKLTPDKCSNRLLSELIAFKLNLYASDVGITPPFVSEVPAQNKTRLSKISGVEPSPFRSLKYIEFSHPLNNRHLHEIDSLADVYMTYGDSSAIGSAYDLYSVLYKINRAFSGPIDTISFAEKLRFTGVKPIAEVSFLTRDTSYFPTKKSAIDMSSQLPNDFELYQNYPNPFNPATTISFDLPEPAIVTLKIFNTIGQEIATLLDHENMEDGFNDINFNAANLSTGVYFYRIETVGIIDPEKEYSGHKYISVKKMLFIK